VGYETRSEGLEKISGKRNAGVVFSSSGDVVARADLDGGGGGAR